MGSLNSDGSKISQDQLVFRRTDGKEVIVSNIQKDLENRTTDDEQFNVADVPNLFAWWDAQDSSTFTVNSVFDVVTSWADKGPNEYDLTQYTVVADRVINMPKVVENGINGKKSLLFGHKGHGLDGRIANTTIEPISPPFSVITVIQPGETDVKSHSVWNISSGNTDYVNLSTWLPADQTGRAAFSVLDLYRYNYNSLDYLDVANNISKHKEYYKPKIITCVYGGDDSQTIYVNYNYSQALKYEWAQRVGFNRVVVGGSSPPSINPVTGNLFTGFFGEMIIIKDDIRDTLLLKRINDYLSNKWKIILDGSEYSEGVSRRFNF